MLDGMRVAQIQSKAAVLALVRHRRRVDLECDRKPDAGGGADGILDVGNAPLARYAYSIRQQRPFRFILAQRTGSSRRHVRSAGAKYGRGRLIVERPGRALQARLKFRVPADSANG